MKRIAILALAMSGAIALAACGDRDQVVVYKQGEYQGKTDSRPWDNAQFGGDKQKWEAALRTRSQSQNEYKRAN